MARHPDARRLAQVSIWIGWEANPLSDSGAQIRTPRQRQGGCGADYVDDAAVDTPSAIRSSPFARW